MFCYIIQCKLYIYFRAEGTDEFSVHLEVTLIDHSEDNQTSAENQATAKILNALKNGTWTEDIDFIADSATAIIG